MSFQQNPSQASATGTTSSSNVASTDNQDDLNSQFKSRTFDVTWVDKSALMYKEGYAKVRCDCCDMLKMCVRSH